MSRRRWLFTQDGQPLPEPIEITEDWQDPGRPGGLRRSEEEVYGHIQATDGTDLSTKRRHREYMKKHGLTLSEDYRESWKKAAEDRARAFTEGPKSATRRESIERAMYQVMNKRRK